jgi:hypothetical protein
MEKNLGGRPKKYTEEFLNKELKAFYEWMKLPESVYFKNFSLERGYSPNRLNEFAEEHAGFSVALEYARDWQQGRLIQLGLFKKTDAGLTKFLLSAVHSMYDHSKTEEKPQTLNVNFVNSEHPVQPEANRELPECDG